MYKNRKIKVYRISDILIELNRCIDTRKPFSLIRFGDGGIKLMHAVLYDDKEQIDAIVKREGLPKNKVDEIISLWAIYSNKADYIDTPHVYFSGEFWGRYIRYRENKYNVKNISEKTRKRLEIWYDLYSQCGIKVNSVKYCNPEANWLSLLKSDTYPNLLQIMKGRKICCISTYNREIFSLAEFDIKYWQIVGHNRNQYKYSFNKTIDFIKDNATKYDLFLNSSGELGRIYSGLIKDCGGRVFDTGFVIDYFNNFILQDRLKYFITKDKIDKRQLLLTEEGKKFQQYI